MIQATEDQPLRPKSRQDGGPMIKGSTIMRHTNLYYITLHYITLLWKRYCSFIHYALIYYQDSISNH